MTKMNTILFEQKYNTNVEDFSTTSQINKFVEDKEGKSLEVVVVKTDIITTRGDVFPTVDINIDRAFEAAIN